MRVWRGRHGAAALLVVATMVGWRAVLLRGSFFNQDDFYLSGRAASSDLTWSYLFRATAGHVNPAQQLTYWLVAHDAPYDWAVVGGFILLLQLSATVVMWHVLTRLLPGRWVRVPLLAAFAWSPLTLATTLWWSAAMGLWPHLLCSLLATLFLLRARQHAGRTWVNLLAVLAATITGLLWHERSVLIPVVLFSVAVAVADEAVGWRRIPAALRRFWPLWATLVVLLAGYLVGHQALTSVTGGGSSADESLSIGWAFVGQNVVPGVASGPWAARLDGGAVEPDLWVTVLSLVLTLAVVVVVLLRGGPARRWALAFFCVYVAADLALVLSGRGGFGRVIGLDPRYSSDVIHAAVLALALALRGAPRHFGVDLAASAWRRRRTVVLAGASALYLVGAGFGSAGLVPHFSNTEDRAYLTNLRGDLAADPNQVIVDTLAPADVVLPLVGEDSLLSHILAPLPESPAFDLPSARMRTVGADGRLMPVKLDGSISMRPGPVPGCGYAVTSSGQRVPLAAPLRGRVVVHLGYFTDRESTVQLRAGAWGSEFETSPGPGEVWFVIPDLDTDVRAVRVQVDGDAVVCVADLDAGLPPAVP